MTMLQKREVKLAEFAERTGDEAMNDTTRRELMISMMPEKFR